MLKRIIVMTCILVLIFGSSILGQGMFTDVPGNHWARESVDKMQQMGALIGYPDRYYKGNEVVTRYQLAVVLARLQGLVGKVFYWEYSKSEPYNGIWAMAIDTKGSLPPFKDVSQKHWACTSVCRLAKTTVFRGYPDGSFQGDKPLTRYELAAGITRTLNAASDVAYAQPVDPEVTPEMMQARRVLDSLTITLDAARFDIPYDHWAYESVRQMLGEDGVPASLASAKYDGNKAATRYELAVYLDKLAANRVRLIVNYARIEYTRRIIAEEELEP